MSYLAGLLRRLLDAQDDVEDARRRSDLDAAQARWRAAYFAAMRAAPPGHSWDLDGFRFTRHPDRLEWEPVAIDERIAS